MAVHVGFSNVFEKHMVDVYPLALHRLLWYTSLNMQFACWKFWTTPEDNRF